MPSANPSPDPKPQLTAEVPPGWFEFAGTRLGSVGVGVVHFHQALQPTLVVVLGGLGAGQR